MIRRRAPLRRKSKLSKKKDDPSSGYWLRKADAAWGAYQHKHRPTYCAVCGGRPVEMHHIIGRAVRHMRHRPDNVVQLCAMCHKWSPLCSPHGGPAGFAEWMNANIPELLKSLNAEARQSPAGKRDYRHACQTLESIT
jgi:hypothetical protein